MTRARYWVTVPADHPDAAVIGWCNEANALHHTISKLTQKADAEGRFIPGRAPEIRPKCDAWHDLVERITFTPAASPEGIRAKAEVLATVVALDEPEVASLVSDILGRKVGDLTTRGLRRYRARSRPTQQKGAAQCAAS
jgi:hypothetical protein